LEELIKRYSEFITFPIFLKSETETVEVEEEGEEGASPSGDDLEVRSSLLSSFLLLLLLVVVVLSSLHLHLLFLFLFLSLSFSLSLARYLARSPVAFYAALTHAPLPLAPLCLTAAEG
jgi:hypothetical protein